MEKLSVKTKINCLNFSLVGAFLLILQVSLAQKKAVVIDKNTLAYNKLFEDKKAVLGKDFSVAIATADSVVYQNTFGDPANVKSAFPIGAASQWLITALIMQFVDEGKISLDDPVKNYLPVFELYRRNYVTIRHCLTNQTGLTKESSKVINILDKRTAATLEEAVTDMLKKEVHANAGEEFRYNVNGFIIAARLVEVLTKKRFDQVIRTKLFVPLGMRGTTFSTDDGSAPNPANGAKSTVADYTRFLQMLLNKGKIGDKQILSATAVEEMQKIQVAAAQTTVVPKAVEGFSYALGSWAPNGEPGAKATTLVLPSFTGTWPMVDFAKGYAFLVFAREFSGEQKAAPYMELKQSIDGQFVAAGK